MKKFTKICLCISLAFIGLAVICLGAGAALGSSLQEVRQMANNGEFDIGDLHIGRWGVFYNPDYHNIKAARTQPGVVSETFAADEVSKLSVDIKFGKVEVTDSDSDQIEIRVDAPKRYQYECRLEDGQARLSDQTAHSIWNNGMLAEEKIKVTIAIPEGKAFEEVAFATNAGKIEISHAIFADEVEFEVDAGELTAEQVTAGDEFLATVDAGRIEIERFDACTLEVGCGLGEVELCGKVLEGLDADCGMGRIALKLLGRRGDYDYTISCGLGMVTLNGTNYSALGTDKEIDNGAGNEVNLKCGIGEITVEVEEE